MMAEKASDLIRGKPALAAAGMTTRQVGEFTVTAVSDGVLYSNHDVILGIDKDDSARLTGVPYGQPLPLDVNCFLIRHRGKLILSDAGTGQGLQPVQKNLGKLPDNLRAIGVDRPAIDIVMLTHLHSDHSMGLLDEAGQEGVPQRRADAARGRGCVLARPRAAADDSERIVAQLQEAARA